jgi:hypothetical protein
MKECSTCQFWRRGDPINKAGNAGLCLFAVTQGPDFYDHPTNVPFWLTETVRRTVSWEGSGCATWREGKPHDRTE